MDRAEPTGMRQRASMGRLEAIANKIIALAKAGERGPDALCEQVLKDIRTEPI